MLGPLFLAAPQLVGEERILLFGSAAASRAGDGMRLHTPALHAHQHFR
jgi:hypothetical protein